MTQIIKDLVLRSDFANWDGLSSTRTKKDSTGGTVTGLKVGTEVDVLQVYGGGINYTKSTIQRALDAIGSNNVTLLFQPGTWTIDSDCTIGSNFTCRVPSGVVFSVSSGKTLTFSGPVIRDNNTWTSGSGTVTENGTRYFTGKLDLTGAVIQGTTPFVFEGSTDDAYETRVVVTDPTADRTITFPDADVDFSSVPITTGNNSFTGNNIFSGMFVSKIPVATNLRINATVGSSALTIALKGNDGNDPSATNPVYVPFRDVTSATGDMVWLAVTAATSLVISSGSTMGTTSGKVNRLWIVAFNDASTFRLGAINCLGSNGFIYSLQSDVLASSTAEGGAGAADSAGVIYTGTAVSSKAMTVLGYVESTQATAGTWATSPSKIQPWMQGMKLPGTYVQTVQVQDSTTGTTTASIPVDNTIPQASEGTEISSLDAAITPTSSCNVLEWMAILNLANSSATAQVPISLIQDATANALRGWLTTAAAAVSGCTFPFLHRMRADTTSTTTFHVRYGASAGTSSYNQNSGTPIFNGVYQSNVVLKEIMA